MNEKRLRQRKTVTLPISQLDLGVYTPRTRYDPKYIRELAESIEIEGQHKPVIVQFKEDEKYPVIDGEYRVRALKFHDEKSVRAEVWKVTDEEALFYAMRINEMHGKRLDIMDEALHIKKMMDQYQYTQEQIAKKLNKRQQWISERIALVDRLSPKVKEKVTAQTVKPTHAITMLTLPMNQQEKVADYVEREHPTKEETRFLVDLVEEKPQTAEKLMEKPISHLRAEMKHGEVISTAERLDEVMLGKDKKQWVENHVCTGCGKHFKINWEDGRIEWVD